MEISYCDNCASKIAPADLLTGTCRRTNAGAVYCPKCAPLFEHTSSAPLNVSLPNATPFEQQATVGMPVLKELPAKSVTKFYFCETCGKRITDKQILDGLGRDKKLKGVYCKDCAVGVMTIEVAAIREVPGAIKGPALSPLASTPQTSPAGAKKESAYSVTPEIAKGNRKASGFGMAASMRSPTQTQANPTKEILSEQYRKSARREARQGTPTMAIIYGIIAFAIVTIIAIVLTSQSSRISAPTKNRASDPIATVTLGTISDESKKLADLRPLSNEAKVERPIQVDPEKLARADYYKMVKFDGLTEGDTVGRVAIVEVFLREHSDSAFAEPARELLNTFKKSLSVPPAPPAHNNTTPVQDSEPTAKQLSPHSGSNSVPKVEDDSNAQLTKVKSDLAEIQALRERAIEALRAKAGTAVTLTVRGARLTGRVKVDLIHADRLILMLRDGPETTIGSEQIDVQDVDAFAPVEMGNFAAQDLRKRGLLFLSAGEFVKAEGYFIKARDLGLGNAVAPYLERIAAHKLDEKDAAALTAWKLAEGLFENKNWKAAQHAYEALQRDYAGSTALTNNAVALKERLAAIAWALGPPRETSLNFGGGIQMELELIPAGEFEMGSNDGDASEKPIHRVKISETFYIGKYTVTQAQYEKVVGINPSSSKGENLPVERVSYFDAEEFCRKAGKLTGNSVRLPTEAEWEYACRAGTKTKFNAGDDDAALEQVGWFKGNSDEKTHPVGLKKPNAWGLYDMHGNVWQWCMDWYGEDYYLKSETENPLGPARSIHRVIRGGAFVARPGSCRSAFRSNREPGICSSSCGFRVVITSAFKATSK